jgi:hypothetical protein
MIKTSLEKIFNDKESEEHAKNIEGKYNEKSESLLNKEIISEFEKQIKNEHEQEIKKLTEKYQTQIKELESNYSLLLNKEKKQINSYHKEDTKSKRASRTNKTFSNKCKYIN